MATLKKEVKVFVVRSLAVFNTPQETADLVNQEFGTVVDRQQVAKYDPTKRTGQNLSQDLREEFWATRNEFLENPKNHVPIANLTVRLQHLQRLIDRHSKNPVLLMDALEQAAKDVGGLYTNQRSIDSTSSDGSLAQRPTVIELVAPQGGTDESTD